MSELIENIEKINTTPWGEERILNNIGLENVDFLKWAKNAVLNAHLIVRKSRNWYVYWQDIAISINAKSYSVVTALYIGRKVHQIKAKEYKHLPEFLYHAIYVKEGNEMPSRDIIKTPEIYMYIDDFGKHYGDYGVACELNGQVMGMAWSRVIPGYGNVDDYTPEIAMSVLPEFRYFGIGTRMLKRICEVLKLKNYDRVSISVHKDNPAFRFYQRVGFKIYDERVDSANHEYYIMLKKLNS